MSTLLARIENLLPTDSNDLEHVKSVESKRAILYRAMVLKDWQEGLSSAGHYNDLVFLQLMIDQGGVNVTRECFSAAFSSACSEGHYEIAEFLLERVADTGRALERCAIFDQKIQSLIVDASSIETLNQYFINICIHGPLSMVERIVQKERNLDVFKNVDEFESALRLTIPKQIDIFEFLLDRSPPQFVGHSKFWPQNCRVYGLMVYDKKLCQRISILILKKSKQPIPCYTWDEIYPMLENGISLDKFQIPKPLKQLMTAKLEQFRKHIQLYLQPIMISNLFDIVCDYSLF